MKDISKIVIDGTVISNVTKILYDGMLIYKYADSVVEISFTPEFMNDFYIHANSSESSAIELYGDNSLTFEELYDGNAEWTIRFDDSDVEANCTVEISKDKSGVTVTISSNNNSENDYSGLVYVSCTYDGKKYESSPTSIMLYAVQESPDPYIYCSNCGENYVDYEGEICDTCEINAIDCPDCNERVYPGNTCFCGSTSN